MIALTDKRKAKCDFRGVRNYEKVAKKVIATKRSFKLEPMNSYERKAIHFALSNIEHIGTHSEGVEPNRCLVIDYIE